MLVDVYHFGMKNRACKLLLHNFLDIFLDNSDFSAQILVTVSESLPNKFSGIQVHIIDF